MIYYTNKEQTKFLKKENYNKEILNISHSIKVLLASLTLEEKIKEDIIKVLKYISSHQDNRYNYINQEEELSVNTSDDEYESPIIDNVTYLYFNDNDIYRNSSKSLIDYKLYSEVLEKYDISTSYYQEVTIFDDIKVVSEKDISELTDNTKGLVTTKISNKSLLKLKESVNNINNYINNNDFKLLKVVKIVNQILVDIDKHTYSKDIILGCTSLNKEYIKKEFNEFNDNINKSIDNILSKEFDYSNYKLEDWTGNLKDEVLANNDAYYIIAKSSYGGKGEEGFVGLKKVYNAKNSNSYTFELVKDIRNAVLFNENSLLNIGYYDILDKVYISSSLKSIKSPKSNLGKVLNTYLEKQIITEKLKETNVESKVVDSAVKKPKNKI